MQPPSDIARLLDKAIQLATIAIDWNLDEVEIDGEMVDTLDLMVEFEKALKKERDAGSQ